MWDVVGQYGDVQKGAASFAQLVGVACSGKCYADASRWSAVALKNGNASVDDAITCRGICASTEECEVWSLQDGECKLLRTVEGWPVLGTVGAEDAISGPVSCGSAFLPFPEGMSTKDTTSISLPSQPDCFPTDVVYGGGKNVCEKAQLLEVHATASTLARGQNEGWWVEGDVSLVPVDQPLEIEQCQAACVRSSVCAGFTLSSGVCQLRASIDCKPSFGLAGVPSTTDLIGTTTFAGTRLGCVNQSHIAEGALADPYYTACDTPRCSTPVTEGFFMPDGTFAPDGCHLDYLGQERASDLMDGRWMVLTGGSNTILFGQTIANLVHGTESFPDGEGNVYGAFKDSVMLSSVLPSEVLETWERSHRNSDVDLVDSVWQRTATGEYTLVYMHSSKWEDLEEPPLYEAGGVWTAGRLDVMERQFAKAPAFVPNSIRVTTVLSQYLVSSEMVLTAVGRTNTWRDAKVVFSVQNGAWYIICGIKNEKACNRDDINWKDKDRLIETYVSEMASFGDTARPLCESDRFSCFFATDAYVGNMGQLVGPAMSFLESTPWISGLDFYKLGSLRPSEILKGHASPFLYLTWAQLMFNTILPTPEAGSSSCAEKAIITESCFGASLRNPVCGEPCACTAYDKTCEAGPYLSLGQCSGQKWDRLWECANERVCTIDGVVLASPSSHSTPSSTPFSTSTSITTTASTTTATTTTATVAITTTTAIATTKTTTTITRNVSSAEMCSTEVDLVAVLAALAGNTTLEEAACPKSRLWCGPTDWAYGLMAFSLFGCAVVIFYNWYRWGDAKQKEDKQPMSWKGRLLYFAWKPHKPATGEHLAGLNAARILASVHIVLGHLYAKGAVYNVYLFGWGFTWVPWFFMLSGYVLTHAQLSKKDPTKIDSIGVFFRKRSSAIFPLYAVGLVGTLIILMLSNRSTPEWYVLLSQGFLAQAWVPWLSEQTIQLHCWFLSAMIPYWCLFGLVTKHMVLKLTRMSTVCMVMLLLSSIPWLAFILPEAYRPQSEHGQWYSGHRTGSLKTWVDVLIAFLKFNPLCYFHVFLFGMCLARLRERLKTAIIAQRKGGSTDHWLLIRLIHFLLLWGTSLGYFVILFVFLNKSVRPYSHKISSRLSILMIPQGLILLGLSPLPPPKQEESKEHKNDASTKGLQVVTAAPVPSVPSQDAVHEVHVTMAVVDTATAPTNLSSPPPSPPATVELAQSNETEDFVKGADDFVNGTEDFVSKHEDLPITRGQCAEEDDEKTYGDGDPCDAPSEEKQVIPLSQVSSTSQINVAAGQFSTRQSKPGIVSKSMSHLKSMATVNVGEDERAANDARWVGDWDIDDTFARGLSPRVKRAISHLSAISLNEISVKEMAVNTDFVEMIASAPAPARSSAEQAKETYSSWFCTPSGDLRVNCSLCELICCDPIAYIFSFAPAAWGNVSYGQYVLQMMCYQVWPLTPLGDTIWAFMVFLLACSWMSAELITNPVRSWWLSQKPDPKNHRYFQRPTLKLWAWPVATVFLLLTMGIPYYNRDKGGGEAAPLAAPYVEVSPGQAVDVKLNWTVAAFEDVDASADPLPKRALINPSFLIVPRPNGAAALLMRAARAHAIIERHEEGVWVDENGTQHIVTVIANEWMSDIVGTSEAMNSTDLTGWDVPAWGLDGRGQLFKRTGISPFWSQLATEWGPLCEKEPKYVPENMTLFRTMVTGPEDPKLFILPDGSAGMSFSSLPPIQTRPGCFQTDLAAVQMYVTHLHPTPPVPAVGMRLQCGEENRDEKNWISFTYGSQLHYVYSIHPHVVVQARSADGECYAPPMWSTSTYAPLQELAETRRYDIHGSATAVMYNGSYLALFHTVDASDRYQTMAYKFQAEPPFAITAVSRPLPLQGAGHKNFASGLVLPPASGKVIVSYGANDLESRALVMSTEYLDQLFDPCTKLPALPATPSMPLAPA